MTPTADGTIKQIEDILQDKLQTDAICVTDTSGLHRGHAGFIEGQITHIKVEVFADKLTALPRLALHRQIYSALDGFIATGLHAIEIKRGHAKVDPQVNA